MWENYILLRFLISFIGAMWAFNVSAQADRFVLIDQKDDASKGEIQAVFVDQYTKEVVVKTYQLASSRGQDVGKLRIPAQVPTLIGVDLAFKKINSEGNVRSHVYPTQTLSDHSRLREKLSDHGVGRAKMAQVTETLGAVKGMSLVENRSTSNKGAAVYFDHHTNQLVMIELPPRTSVSRSISSPSDLNINDIKVTRIDAQTPGQFSEGLRELSKKFQRIGMQFNSNVYQTYFDEVKNEFGKFSEFLEEDKRENGQRHQYKMSYSHDQRKLLIEKFKRKNNGLEFVEEKVFDLATERGHRDALAYLQRNALNEREAINHLITSHADGCLWPSPAPTTLALPGLSRVMDRLYDDFLAKALPNQLLPTGEKDFQMEVSLLDEKAKLQFSVNSKGELGDVSFVGKAPRGYRIVKSENKEAQPAFVIEFEDQGEWKPLMGFVTENVLRYQGGAVDFDLAVYVVGKKDGEASYEGFEKSLFQLSVRPQKRIYSSARVQLDSARAAAYPMGERPEDSGGLKNFFMQIFYSKNARRNEVRDTIITEVKKALDDPDFKNLLSVREIERAADRVTDRVGQRTNNFDASLTRLTAVSYEEAMKEFVRAIMLKLMGQLLPDENVSELLKILEVTERDFHACLRNASDNRNVKQAEECLAVFKFQAPIDMGIGALKAKLKGAGINGADAIADKEYNRCIDQYYRPIMRREGASAQAQDLVKACVMSTAMQLLDQVLKDEVRKQASAVELSPGVKWSIPEASLNVLHQKTLQCFADEKLLKIGFPRIQIDTRALMRVDSSKFTTVLDDCMGRIKSEVGEMAVKELLGAKINEMAPMSQEKANQKIETVLARSFRPCIEDMKKNRVSIDPTLCTSEVMIDAVSELIGDIGSKEIGEAAYSEVM